MHYLGLFAIKQQAAAAYDSAARLHHGNAVCNYDNQMDADEAIREASQINGLINAGFMSLTMRWGPASKRSLLAWRNAERGADEMADRYLVSHRKPRGGSRGAVQMFHMRQRWGGCGVTGANAGPPW